jgi:AcrR family transcriptional regulator
VSDSVTTRRRDATRQRLLDAAAEVFAEVGLDAASVEAVCERAGFTRGAFYSNFESKDELFLELARRVTGERLVAVQERVAELEAEGTLEVSADSALEIVQRVLDIAGDDRLGVLLLSEIRIRALRDPQLAQAYLAWDDELLRSVTQIVADIERAKGLRLRVTAAEAARMLVTIWDSSTVRGTMAGIDYDEICRRTNEDIARAATLVLDLP